MKRKVLMTICVILGIILLKLIYSYLMNSILINKYENSEYDENIAKSLDFLNFTESYIANYNYGNVLYKNGKYEDAIEQYKQALQRNVPEDRDCSVRINYALAICKNVQVDESNEQSIRDAIKQYESAIDVLTENGCANKEDNNGHNKDAEQLKEDIQKEIDRLKKLLESSSDSESDEKNESNENKENNENETEEERKEREKIEQMEKKINDIKQDATQTQREKEKKYEELNNYSFNRPERNW